jgi:phosphate transport system protein
MILEDKLNELNEKLYNYVDTIELVLKNRIFNDNFYLIDLKEFDNEIIKLIAIYHPQGEFLRESVALLKISAFLAKIKNSTKYFIKNYDFKNEKIEELVQNAILSVNTIKEALKSEDIEEAFSKAISYEKIAEELFFETLIDIKEKNSDEIIKTLNIAKKLERISDGAKIITKYILYAKEGVEL